MDQKISIVESKIKMPLMELPIKSTVVSLGKNIILISPLPHLAKFKSQIEQWGTPTDIVAPNGFHHMGIKEASEMYPSARLWGVPILKTKRSDILWNGILPREWPFSDQLNVFPINGMPKIDEVVFYHPLTKTLIVTDLFFNHVHGKGIGNWIIFNMFGTYKRFAVSKFFGRFIESKKEFSESIQKILALDIERIIIPHGENIVENAKKKIQQAFSERNFL